MKLTFITGNENKYNEVKSILSEVPDLVIEREKIDLPEIQSVDVENVIREKLREGYRKLGKPIFVEDVGFFFDGLNGLPGALVKWFLERLGIQGCADLLKGKDNSARVECCVGYTEDGKDLHIFKGIVKGIIVDKRGNNGFGFDHIFQPDGHERTFAEMTMEEKNRISHRRLAFDKLKEFLR